jgi:hypothetical protein
MTGDPFDDEDPAAIMGTSSKCATMADGSLRVQVDIMPALAQQAFKMFGTPGSAVALARLTDAAAVEEERPGKPEKGPHGEWAKLLVQSGFFRTPKIWEAIGSDNEFLGWVKSQKSAVSGEFSEYHDDGECYCIPAHYRKVGLGSGTAIKPPYSAIPLTKAEHDLTHAKGDIALGDELWWDKKRIKYVSQWAYETLKQKMFHSSYTTITPHELLKWAQKHNVADLLPMKYHTLEDPDDETTESQAKGAA